MFETLKEWVTAATPGFVTRDDMTRLEGRLDELLELVEALEEQLGVSPPSHQNRR